MSFLNNVTFWMVAALIAIVGDMLLVFVLIIVGKRTHAIKEFVAGYKGVPLCLFFTDHKGVEWQFIKPTAGIIQSPKYGTFIVNEKGSYIDKTTKNIILPFSAELGTGAAVSMFADAHQLSEVIKDMKKMAEVRKMLAKGELDDARFDCVKESVNFSELRGLTNTLMPHGISSFINQSISQNYGASSVKPAQQLMWYIIAGIGLIFLAGLVAWLTMGNHTPTVNIDAAQLARTVYQNASIIAG